MPSRSKSRISATVFLFAGLAMAAIAPAADISTFAKQPDGWFRSKEGRRILDHVLSWQNENGGWPKAYDLTKPRPGGKSPTDEVSTFDNKATWSEMRLLARAVRLTKDDRYEEAFSRGLEFIFLAQYPNGGWPQRFPLEDNCGRHITYNDDAMVEVVRLVRDVAAGKGDCAFVSDDARQRARVAYDAAIECILNTQIRVDGWPTVWCAQHHAQTLEPKQARAYELPSFSGGESAGIALLLMEIENPNDRVKRAVRGAAHWYEKSKLTGIRLEQKPDKSAPKGFDVVVVADANAPPLWARFYDLEPGKPIYCGRDGVKKASPAEVEIERRAGYAWLRSWGQKLLDAYPKWAAKHGQPKDPATPPTSTSTTAPREHAATIKTTGSAGRR